MLCEHIGLGGATLDAYLLERIPAVAATQARPCVVVLPGGGYGHLSARESEPVALRFCGEGLHACVLRYSVAPARWPQALVEAAGALALLRERSAEWGIDPARIYVAGFSAGGHLAGCLGAFWNQPWLAERAGRLLATVSVPERELAPGKGPAPQAAPMRGACAPVCEDIRPSALVLGYPVITSGAFGHHGSFETLCAPGLPDAADPASLGASSTGELVSRLSLEHRVTEAWPPTFLWHTFDDQSVPVENSLLLAAALHESGVPAELHVFPHGPHGSALGVAETAMDKCGEFVCDPASGRVTSRNNAQVQPDTIATWPDLALRWLRSLPVR